MTEVHPTMESSNSDIFVTGISLLWRRSGPTTFQHSIVQILFVISLIKGHVIVLQVHKVLMCPLCPSLPELIAFTTSVSPVVTSPAANTPCIDVLYLSSIAIEFFLPILRPAFLVRNEFGCLPTARRTLEHSILNAFSGMGSGVLLPDSSGAVSCIKSIIALPHIHYHLHMTWALRET